LVKSEAKGDENQVAEQPKTFFKLQRQGGRIKRAMAGTDSQVGKRMACEKSEKKSHILATIAREEDTEQKKNWGKGETQKGVARPKVKLFHWKKKGSWEETNRGGTFRALDLERTALERRRPAQLMAENTKGRNGGLRGGLS